MKILDLAGSWWLWKWFLTIDVTKKRLFNPDLEYEVVCDQKASQPWSWQKVTKGFFYLETEVVCDLRDFLPQSGVVYDLRASLPRFGVVEMSIKGLLYLNLDSLKCWLKVFSTPIWNCWNGDQRSSLLQSGVVEMVIKGFLYFNLDCWNVDQRSSLPQFGVVEMSIKGLVYLNLNLDLLKWWSKFFSTSIWSCWNVDQRSSLP